MRCFPAVVTRPARLACLTVALAGTAAALTGCRTDTEVRSSAKPAPPESTAQRTGDAASDSPSLVGTPPGVRLVLPPRFGQVLAAEPAFVTHAPGEFADEFLSGTNGWSYPWSEREAPFAVIADFDGDRRRDVALLQRSPDEGRAVAVLDHTAGPRVVELRRWKRADAGETGRRSSFYLRIHPAGPLHVPDFGGDGSDTTVTLAHEGIEVVVWGKTARTYWYADGSFASLTTAD